MANLKGIGKGLLGLLALGVLTSISVKGKIKEHPLMNNDYDCDDDLPVYCRDCYTVVKRINSELYRCPKCGSEYEWGDGEWWFHSNDNDEWADDIPSRPQVCTGCGSDMWPDCQYSCNRFDN